MTCCLAAHNNHSLVLYRTYIKYGTYRTRTEPRPGNVGVGYTNMSFDHTRHIIRGLVVTVADDGSSKRILCWTTIP